MRIRITENQYKRIFEETLPGEAPNFDGGTDNSIGHDQIGITTKTTDTDGSANGLSTKVNTDKVASVMNLSNNTWSARR